MRSLFRTPDPSAAPQDDRAGGTGFTLIEVLVVIAVIALLMAILVPVLGKVRKQAKALACQANLRQWALALQTYATANDAKVPRLIYRGSPTGTSPEFPLPLTLWRYIDSNEVWLCPMARQPSQEGSAGETFRAWAGPVIKSGQAPTRVMGSYGQNFNAFDPTPVAPAWLTIDVPGAARVPFYFDCIYPAFLAATSEEGIGPPPQQRGCRPDPETGKNHTSQVCINRHDGGINMAFLDSSVRKVGLKELWTLKWNYDYNTANRWTRAGGVRPEDWPQWMRRFKDY